jgi:hypothetical protein
MKKFIIFKLSNQLALKKWFKNLEKTLKMHNLKI